ncbi:1-phosphatidylinositol 4,5-bisphosphate phosphodiesterase delta-1 isoform X2 [Protopterus annectens]|uniref:1-phosphatidylinositol 4,5-bisphosphate phosphodiesterase delta-1 isoform X2 n=1 Tax=Protopterus annectens TaxID=7888 RepID=UPI001CFBD9A6|nr:1-phosphatidylinositol 4,5-bisphosphate phosphodiesterase delta-1 isoform X2 [Protopterus annectens]
MQCFWGQARRPVYKDRIPQDASHSVAIENAARLGLKGDADLEYLLTGSRMDKVKSSTWKKERFYRLQDDCKTVWHESSKLLKSRKSQIFSVDDIEDVTIGHQTEGMQKYAMEYPASQCLSIIFRGDKKDLDLVASSSEEASHWFSGIMKIRQQLHIISTKLKMEHWIYYCLQKADKNKDRKISFEELKEFLSLVNIEIDDVYAKEIFQKCDKSNSDTLEDSEIEEFCKLLLKREEISDLFSNYSDNDNIISTSQLAKFLSSEQFQNLGEEYAVSLIEKYEINEAAKKENLMTEDGFLVYLLSPDGDIFNPAHRRQYQDMTQPLSHYFISSSHNTYLTEDQLTSQSSTKAYKRALSKGCRCVELDCWDGPNDEPVIYHGYTLTSKILFKDVIQKIKDYAFKASPYPVILSLENHCIEQQGVLAKHLKNTLGSMLLTAPVNEDITELPSPEELKGKILVKAKLQSHGKNSSQSSSSEESSEESESEEKESNNTQKSKLLPLAKELFKLAIYCKSVRFEKFKYPLEKNACCEMSSFPESKAMKLAKESATSFIHHNTRQLSRIYPSGSRIFSSNYSPVDLWNIGCQLVSLNFQTSGKEMDLYQGKFHDNGCTGYILKPKFLQDSNSKFNPWSLTPGEWLMPQKFVVKALIQCGRRPFCLTSVSLTLLLFDLWWRTMAHYPVILLHSTHYRLPAYRQDIAIYTY